MNPHVLGLVAHLQWGTLRRHHPQHRVCLKAWQPSSMAGGTGRPYGAEAWGAHHTAMGLAGDGLPAGFASCSIL